MGLRKGKIIPSYVAPEKGCDFHFLIYYLILPLFCYRNQVEEENDKTEMSDHFKKCIDFVTE